MVGEPDTDALAELPWPVLKRWQQYMTMDHNKAKGLPPDKAFAMLRKMYPPRKK